MNARILLVDDDPLTLKTCRQVLELSWRVDTATGGTAGLEAVIHNGPYDVIVADLHMPDLSGLDMLIETRRIAPDTVRLMLTGANDPTAAIDAINAGRVFRFLKKPCAFEALEDAVREAVDEHQRLVRESTILEETRNGAVHLLAHILSEVDPAAVTAGQGLAARAKELCAHLNIPASRDLEAAALLLHVGVIGLPVSVNAKIRVKKPLTAGETDSLRHLPELGAQLLTQISQLTGVAEIVRYQDKGFDGIGSPVDDVRGTRIPLGARLLCPLVDLHALEAGGLSSAQAMKQLRRRASRYDPQILNALALLTEEWAARGTRRPEAKLITELREGMELERDIMTEDGFRIAAAGTKLSEAAIERLRNFADQGRIRETMFVVFETPAARNGNTEPEPVFASTDSSSRG